MRQLEPVIWTRGTFLNPQHLQIQDRFLESSLDFHLQSLHFRAWGFSSLKIDHAQLAAGTFAVTEASGITGDGLLFDVPSSDAAPPPRPVAAAFGPDQTTLDVYLAIPSYREGGYNIANAADAETRYRAEMKLLRDENTGQNEKPVMVARKNFRLLFEGEKRETQDSSSGSRIEGFSSLRIARVEKSPSNVFTLQSGFVPPLVDFRASDYLMSIARRVLEVLTSRSTALAAARRQKNPLLTDFTSADIPAFWLLYTINTALPEFRHLFEIRGGHPEQLYRTMLALAGSLTTFSTKVQPADLPNYDHDNLGGCFKILDEKLHLLLETVVPSNFVSLPLRFVTNSVYATAIDKEEYLQKTRFYFAIKAESQQADIISRVPYLVKIASADMLEEEIIPRALAGVVLKHVPTPPSVIATKVGYQYFSLQTEGSAWQSIVIDRNLAAFVPADFPNPIMEVAIVLPQPAS